MFLLYLAKSEIPGAWQKENLGRSAPIPDRGKRSNPTLTTLSSPGSSLLERENL